MHKQIPIWTALTLLISLHASSQPAAPAHSVVTTDIDNFWVAYDSAQTTADSLSQLHFIQTLYVEKGTPGLKAFMEARDYTAPEWVSVIRRYPKFWQSIRPDIISLKSRAEEIAVYIQKFKELYPQLSAAKIYFTVGCLHSGGTTMDSLILIGTEIAAGNPHTDVSEFPDKWLSGVFQSATTSRIVPLNMHEYVHTQQKKTAPQNLLGIALREGAADFIAELVLGSPMKTNYIDYGKAHEPDLKRSFAAEMFSASTSRRWLWTGTEFRAIPDLGYFMGYTICGAYYKQTQDKQQAIRDIIELDYADTIATENFLKTSGYYPVFPDKATTLAAIGDHIPTQTVSPPFVNGDSTVAPGPQTIYLQFSQPLAEGGYWIHAGEESKDSFPTITKMELSVSKRTLTLQVMLLPGRSYTLVNEFLSTEGYNAKSQLRFKTRAGFSPSN